MEAHIRLIDPYTDSLNALSTIPDEEMSDGQLIQRAKLRETIARLKERLVWCAWDLGGDDADLTIEGRVNPDDLTTLAGFRLFTRVPDIDLVRQGTNQLGDIELGAGRDGTCIVHTFKHHGTWCCCWFEGRTSVFYMLTGMSESQAREKTDSLRFHVVSSELTTEEIADLDESLLTSTHKLLIPIGPQADSEPSARLYRPGIRVLYNAVLDIADELGCVRDGFIHPTLKLMTELRSLQFDLGSPDDREDGCGAR